MFLPRTPLYFSKICNLNLVSSVNFVLQSHSSVLLYRVLWSFQIEEVKNNVASKESNGENCHENYFSLKTFSQFECLNNFKNLEMGNPQHFLPYCAEP